MANVTKFTIAEKLRVLALKLDRKESRNPFVRAWTAFWSKPSQDDSMQQDLRSWAAALSLCTETTRAELNTDTIRKHLERLADADKVRRYDSNTGDLIT